MYTDNFNKSDFNAISEPVAPTDDVPMNNNVLEADVKPIDNNEGGVNVQDAPNTESSANGGTTEERTMSKREQKRALKRKVEQRVIVMCKCSLCSFLLLVCVRNRRNSLYSHSRAI
jgi:hypothetical protein